jgi:predicted HicB family RNase H-like nuclease
MPSKSFKENLTKTTTPSSAFLSHDENAISFETKSQRLQLLVKPSLYKKLRNKANSSGKSMNSIMNDIMENYL